MKILLPVDGSEVSLKAVRFAIELMRQGLQADVVLANVQDPVSLYEMVRAPDPQVLESVSEGAGAYLLEGAEALLKQAGVVYECEVASGDPGHTIIDIVERFGREGDRDLEPESASELAPLRGDHRPVRSTASLCSSSCASRW